MQHPICLWQRWLIIYNALVEPRKAEEIARHCGVSKATVHDVISRYNRFGVAAIETTGTGGRRRQYVTLEEEKEFLAPFFAQAERGEIATVGQIWHAFEKHVGHEVDDSTIYRLLHRHGWRKVMPRPKHPKGDPETQEQFKKTFQLWWKQQWPRKRPTMNAPFSFWRRMKAVLAGSARRNAPGRLLGCVRMFQSRWSETIHMSTLRSHLHRVNWYR
jgi:transposase